MIKYSIRELEQLTDIKAHTIRIWEQRYGILKPQRTDTNIRYYSDADLRFLLQISLLNQSGYKISKIATINRSTISDLYQEIVSNNYDFIPQINALVKATVEIDEKAFTTTLNNNIAQNGFKTSITKIVYPLLERIGILWAKGNIHPGQEHFISNLIRQKIVAKIDSIYPENKQKGVKCLLFLPENEFHELGLLFAQYLLKVNGYEVIYLGASVPFDNLIDIAKFKKVEVVFGILTTKPTSSKVKAYITQLAEGLKGVKVYLSGYKVQNLENLPANIEYINKPMDLVSALEQKANQPKENSKDEPPHAV